jgi:phenylacetate-coenzyme A ligase PaaK-like adenylate-forming protein
MTLTPLESWIARKIGGNTITQGILEQWQLSRLRETIDHARTHSPFYRERLKNHGTPLSDLSDLARLPFTIPDDVRTQPLRFLCISQSEIKRVVTLQSSGTTGKPKRLYFTAEDIEHTLDFFAAGMSTFTRAGERVLILLPGELPDSVGDLLARALSRIGACGVRHGPVRDAAKTLSVIQQERITVIVGIPTQVLELARRSQGLALSVAHVLLTTDYVPASICQAVEKAWGCRVYHHYGMTETGLGGGVDCEARLGYHLREADLYFEIIDPATGNTLPEGATGEIVVTTLTRTGMPLIRYRTGDLSRWLPGPCPCGTVLRRLEHVRGRIGQEITLRNGCTLTLHDLDDALFAVEGMLDYRAAVVQGAGTCRLQLQLRAVPDGAPDLSSESRDALLRAPALQRSFLDGSLLLESVVSGNAYWCSDGVAKRTLSVAVPAASGPF